MAHPGQGDPVSDEDGIGVFLVATVAAMAVLYTIGM
jgi:hypothetical protein